MGRLASPRYWHVVKKQAHRLVCASPSFIVSPTPHVPRNSRMASVSRGRGCGPGSGGPSPRFASSGSGAAGTAAPQRLCLKVGLRGPHSLPAGPGHSSLGMGYCNN